MKLFDAKVDADTAKNGPTSSNFCLHFVTIFSNNLAHLLDVPLQAALLGRCGLVALAPDDIGRSLPELAAALNRCATAGGDDHSVVERAVERRSVMGKGICACESPAN